MSKENVLIAGGSGMVGQFLSKLLQEEGYEVSILGRSKKEGSPYNHYVWDLKNMTMDEEAILHADHIINLAGAGIADALWTESRKKLIIDSRVNGNALIKKTIESTGAKPRTFIGASAIGYYGNTGSEELTEESKSKGEDFMVECCEKWEASSQSIADLGIRTCIYRIGIVFSTKGGALEKILLSFKLGVGAYFGSGDQFYSWIHIEDLAKMFLKGIQDSKMEGIYNAVGPNPVSNKAMTYDIKKALNSWAIVMPAPAFILKTVMGDMSKTVFNSNKVIPAKFQKEGFQYKFPEVLEAVKDVVNRKI